MRPLPVLLEWEAMRETRLLVAMAMPPATSAFRRHITIHVPPLTPDGRRCDPASPGAHCSPLRYTTALANRPCEGASDMAKIKAKGTDGVLQALDAFKIELPSWGFADTGTRFGKFFQDAAASTMAEKLHDAGLVNKMTGACPTVAVHVLWDFKSGQDPREVVKLARKNGVRIGAINPNVFQDQEYKFGSYASPSADARKMAMDHTLDSIQIGRQVGSKHLSIWIGDGTNYPGQDNFLRRKHDLIAAFKKMHAAMEKSWPGATLLIEYKPFEPSFYHTDIADWGMADAFCRAAGKRAKVLVDTGHHFQGVNIEHIVAFLLDEGRLGGFHFNDRKYADDDLTLGSIDPYAIFRIFDQITQWTFDTGKDPKLAYMVDQCHNIKLKIEAMVQTVDEAQKLFAKAQLVDRKALAVAQARTDTLKCEELLRDAYETDVRPILREWRRNHGVPADPIKELRSSGIIDRLGRERAAARRARGEVQKASFA
jgi:L-rhamnose isomerase/sugar isomerase